MSVAAARGHDESTSRADERALTSSIITLGRRDVVVATRIIPLEPAPTANSCGTVVEAQRVVPRGCEGGATATCLNVGFIRNGHDQMSIPRLSCDSPSLGNAHSCSGVPRIFCQLFPT